MNCEKCGAELPENVTVCPECGASSENPTEAMSREDGTGSRAVRSLTIPQRPRTAYPKRRPERKNGEAVQKKSGKTRIIILMAVIALLLCAAVFWGYRILQNGQEEPNLGESENSSSNSGNDSEGNGTSLPDTDGED